jgi:hypothetical protein
MEQGEQALAEARRAGIDLDLIDTTLRQSVAERWRQDDAAANLAENLRQAKATHGISNLRSRGAGEAGGVNG